MIYKYNQISPYWYGSIKIASNGDYFNIEDITISNITNDFTVNTTEDFVKDFKEYLSVVDINSIIENNISIIPKLIYLGILKDNNNCRDYNVGQSNYSKHVIQPWSIWLEYNLNPFDADIIKRVLRTKRENGFSDEQSRIMDYEKIIHICNERLRQLTK